MALMGVEGERVASFAVRCGAGTGIFKVPSLGGCCVLGSPETCVTRDILLMLNALLCARAGVTTLGQSLDVVG